MHLPDGRRSILPCRMVHAEFRRNDHREDALHFSGRFAKIRPYREGLTVRSQSTDADRQAETALSVSCYYLCFSGFTVRGLLVQILSLSILSAVRILSGFFKKMLYVVCISGRTRTWQSCPGFRYHCPPRSACTTSKVLAFETLIRTDVLINLQSINNLNIDKRHPS